MVKTVRLSRIPQLVVILPLTIYVGPLPFAVVETFHISSTILSISFTPPSSVRAVHEGLPRALGGPRRLTDPCSSIPPRPDALGTWSLPGHPDHLDLVGRFSAAKSRPARQPRVVHFPPREGDFRVGAGQADDVHCIELRPTLEELQAFSVCARMCLRERARPDISFVCHGRKRRSGKRSAIFSKNHSGFVW